MNLRVKKLMKMPIGTFLEVYYGNGQVFAGTISEKDDECIAISNEKNEIVINYEDIELYVEGTIDKKAFPQEEMKIPKADIVSEKDTSVHSFKPSFEVAIEKISVSDNCLKEAFSELDTSSKKKLNNRYDRFMYALRTTDWDRANQSFHALMGDIESDDDLYNDNKVWQFAALMSARCNRAEDEILIKGRCFSRAAVNAYYEEKYTHAGVYACLAVLYDNIEDVAKMMYTIIFNCCTKCNDAGAAVHLLKNSDISELDMQLLQALFAAKNEKISEMNISQRLKDLENLYINTNMVEIIQSVINENSLPCGKKSVNLTDTESKDILPIQCSGKIFKLIWSKDEGKIEYGGDEIKYCSFKYSDISDENLKKEVDQTLSTNVEEKNWYVTFDLVNDTASNIRREQRIERKNDKAKFDFYEDRSCSVLPEEALKRGRNIVSSRSDIDRFADAADTFEIALDCEKDRTDALAELINACVAYKNAAGDESDSGEKYLKKALEKYSEYNDKIVHDLKYDVAAFGLMTKYGNTSDKVASIERLLKWDAVKPQQRLVYICALADIYLKEAEQTKDKTFYEKAKKSYQEWESLFYSNVQLFSAAAINNTYYTRILVSLASCLIKLEESEQAEQILTKILKYDPSIEAADKMYNELSGDFNVSDYSDDGVREDYDVFDDEKNNTDDDEVICMENLQPYTDVAGWDELGVSEDQVMQYILSVRGKNKNMYTAVLLKVISGVNDNFIPLYNAVSLAIDNPLERLGYSAADILSAFSENSDYGETIIAYSFAAASLRSAFYQTNGSDYMLSALCDSIQLCSKYPVLREIYDILSKFKNQYGKGVDTFAAYRFNDISTQESKLSEIVRKITEIYDKEFANKLIRENVNQFRFKITKVFVYEKGGVLETTLRTIKDNDISGFESVRNSFAEKFIRSGSKIQKSNIQDTKIDAFIDECWERAGRDERVAERKTSDLMGSLRNNLRSHIANIVNIVCDWNELYETGLVATIDSEEKEAFTRLEGKLTLLFDVLNEELNAELADADDNEFTSISLLAATVDELSRKLTGDWNQNERKYYFADFLSSNCILLDKTYLPNLSSTFYSLPEFNIFSRLCRHIENNERSIVSNAEKIYSRDKYYNNFGTAELIAEYTQDSDSMDSWYLPENADKYCMQAEEKIKSGYKQFIEDIQLANGKGQIMLYDKFMSCIEDTAAYWYSYCLKTKNFGFFFEFVDACMEKIHSEASVYKEKLLKDLNLMYESTPDLFKDVDTKTKVEEQIEGLNFLVAEDWMNRLGREDFYNPSSNTENAVDNLRDFWNEFDRNYDSSKDTGVTLKLQVNKGGYIPAKDKRGGMSLIANWLSNGNRASCVKIEAILNALGWENIDVTDISSDTLECYRIKFTEQYTKRNYPHPIAAFGTAAKNTGFNVVCLYGFYDANRLINEYYDLENISGNKIILLDYALNAAERRRLARKVKEITLYNTYMFIDRVSILYVANHYVSGMNNGMLMSISLPFSYYQPYNDISTIEMAPEMFIGREDELLSIESPTGANLIFGGRQLGKSSLLKKAKNDIDGDELGRKAVFVDLRGMDYKASALKISRELVDRGILPKESETSDWDDLERAITNRLRDEENEIPYLLLMLDEADCLIESSKKENFLPMVKLKNIQQSSNGRFKFVLAGLHDLVRFNRSVALGKNSVITHLSYINVKPFKHEDAKKLLQIPLSYLGFSFNDNSVLISQILAATNYFPGLIQLYCKKLIEAMKSNYAAYNENDTPPYIVTETHIKKVLSDKSFRDEIKSKFDITLTLDKTYHLIALIIALIDDEKPNQNVYSAKDILDKARGLAIDPIASFDEEQVNAFLGELADLNILKSADNETYSFSTKNFRDMLGSKSEIEETILSLME